MKKFLLTFLTTLILFAGFGNSGVLAQTCSNVGDTCCDAAFGAKSCGFTLVCDTATNKCINSTCGASGQACCPGAVAGTESCSSSGLTCTNHVCVGVAVACGGDGQACCIGAVAGSQFCNGNLTCQNNSCANPPVNNGNNGGGGVGNTGSGSPIQGGCGVNSISTAIGCIPYGDQNALFGFFIRWGIGIAGGIAFLLILVAGFQIMTSRGDPKRLQAGQELMTSAIAGVLLLIFSLVILRIIGFDILQITAFQ